jgi:hypothetical protein
MASSRLRDWKGKEVSRGLENVGCLNFFRLDLDNVDILKKKLKKKTCFHFIFGIFVGDPRKGVLLLLLRFTLTIQDLLDYG